MPYASALVFTVVPVCWVGGKGPSGGFFLLGAVLGAGGGLAGGWGVGGSVAVLGPAWSGWGLSVWCSFPASRFLGTVVLGEAGGCGGRRTPDASLGGPFLLGVVLGAGRGLSSCWGVGGGVVILGLLWPGWGVGALGSVPAIRFLGNVVVGWGPLGGSFLLGVVLGAGRGLSCC